MARASHCNRLQSRSTEATTAHHHAGEAVRPAEDRRHGGTSSPRTVNQKEKSVPDKEHTKSASESENPVIPAPTAKKGRPRTNKDWWPNQLDLSVLHHHSNLSNPMEEEFNYAEQFKSLDLDALRQDLIAVMTASQEWWPADYGHYGPFFIR